MVIFVVCVVIKLIIEGAYCFFFAKSLFGNNSREERSKVVLGFKVYFGHMFFEGFKMSFFLNYYTRMLEGKDKKQMPEIARGMKNLYIFELIIIWCLFATLFAYYYNIAK